MKLYQFPMTAKRKAKVKTHQEVTLPIVAQDIIDLEAIKLARLIEKYQSDLRGRRPFFDHPQGVFQAPQNPPPEK
jgi:hypothetical protein